jgi:hypothetical protein
MPRSLPRRLVGGALRRRPVHEHIVERGLQAGCDRAHQHRALTYVAAAITFSIRLSELRSLHQAPVIVVFFLAQKAFVEGVTLTAVKGMRRRRRPGSLELKGNA